MIMRIYEPRRSVLSGRWQPAAVCAARLSAWLDSCVRSSQWKTRQSRSLIASSSGSPATPATACSSPAAASPTPPRVVGNDLATLPDFPAEIRAPAGTPHGVSAFQIHFASRDILTPGDHPNVLVAMNPAALNTEPRRAREGRHA